MQITSRTSLKNHALALIGASLLIVACAALYSSLQKGVFANDSTCYGVNDALPAWLTQRVNENRSVYDQVARETGVPWAVMAAIHYREFNNNASENPWNGQGIYQLYSLYHHPDPATRNSYRQLAARSTTVTRDNFLQQTRLAAKFLQEKSRMIGTAVAPERYMTANESNMNIIKNALFSYNGRATAYFNQAASYGFDSSTHPFEGSPYVMSKFDCLRSQMGIITYDGGASLGGVDTRMGAFTLYARLRGESFWKNLQSTSLSAASRVNATVIKASTDKGGDIAQVGFSLSRKPASNVTLRYQVSSPSNARLLNSTITITPRSWNNPRQNVIQVQGLNNTSLQGTFEYFLAPSASPSSTDGNFRSIAANHLPRVKLIHQDTRNNNAVYRLYSPTLKRHAFTASGLERNQLISEGWRDEGARFNYCSSGNQIVTRFSSGTTDEFRLALENSAQAQQAVADGLSPEKYDFATSSLGSLPVYWRYDPTGQRSLYTTNKNEAVSAPWQDMGIAFYACDSQSQVTYRLFRTDTNTHFITRSPTERNSLSLAKNFRYEGAAFYGCREGDIPVYRLYRPDTKTHFLTTSNSERISTIRTLGFRDEGVGFRLCSDNSRDVYRLYRLSTRTHFWTVSPSENRSLSRTNDFRAEGTAFYAQ